MLSDLTVETEGIFRQPSTQAHTIRQRELVKIWFDGRVGRDVTARWQDTIASVRIRHYSSNCLSQVFSQRLIAKKEEHSIAFDWPAKASAKLIPLKLRLLATVKKVTRVQIVIAMKLVKRTLKWVRAGFGHCIDLSAKVPAKLSAIGIRFDAKLPDCFYAKRRTCRAARWSICEIVLRRAIQEVDVWTRILTIDAGSEPVSDYWPSIAMGVRDNARLQECEISVISPVQR